MKLRLKAGVTERIMTDRNLESEEQLAAILGVDLQELKYMRDGAPISRAMALHVATIQGTNFDLSPWVEWIKFPENEIPAA